ncbi:MAG TPA: HAD family phosphatase [Rhizomicrobium sp.]|nr:HAD family phosphatase [Rhizomicrobium sp.]
MIEAVIFDCDGVLVDSEVLAVEVELMSLAEIGLDYDEEEFKARFMGMSTTAFYDALDADHLARLGSNLPDGFRDLCSARYRASWHRLGEVPGAREAVAKVSHLKAVASSSSDEALNRKLKLTDLWEPFTPHIYSADHVTHAKPAPDLFLHAAEALQIAPERCLVFEDSGNGVRAARAAGMPVWGFMGGGHMNDAAGRRLLAAGADKLVCDWAEASRMLAGI